MVVTTLNQEVIIMENTQATRKPFIGGGTITVDDDERGFCAIFPAGNSSPFSKEVCDYFKGVGRTFGKEE